VVRKFRKTLALSLAVLGMTSTLALAQPSNTNANTGSQDPYWNQSWNYVGSGGSNLGLRNGRNPFAEPLEPRGFNDPGADHSGYFVSPGS
jgi:nucleoside-specific outer membrane channel protein Tsx